MPVPRGGPGDTKPSLDCFSPMLCHCKLACTNSTISLMFGCKLPRGRFAVLRELQQQQQQKQKRRYRRE
ncbi:unnamed protein product [Lampetra fluviatilis]